MSLAEGRVVSSVAGAGAGRGGAYQSRIHSGGAVDLDSISPGGEKGREGRLRVNTSARGGGEREGATKREDRRKKRDVWIHHQC